MRWAGVLWTVKFGVTSPSFFSNIFSRDSLFSMEKNNRETRTIFRQQTYDFICQQARLPEHIFRL